MHNCWLPGSKLPLVHLVDDDDAMRESMKFVVIQAGYQCLDYADSESFLANHDTSNCGCCVFDHCLGKSTGIDLLKSYHQLELALPVIFLTGFGTVRNAVEAMKLGAIDFLEKPVDTTMLLECIRKAIALDIERRAKRQVRSFFQNRLDTLSQRERQILQLIADGFLSKQIAARLNISQKTVEVHRSNINRKMGVVSSNQLIRQLTESQSV